MDKVNRAYRVLKLYSKLIKGDGFNKKKMADLFNVDEKTIERDIIAIEEYMHDNDEMCDIKYIREEKGYFLSRKSKYFNKKDILAVIKILLESRAFCKEELEHLIDSILRQANMLQRKYIKELIGNEEFNYIQLTKSKPLLEIIWQLSEFIIHKEIIIINYIKMNGDEVKREVKPVGIIFSEYYFYLIGYYDDLDFPIVFRIDRIKKYEMKNEKYHIPYSKRFQDGEFKKRVQFMYSGKLIKIKFKFWGPSLDAVLDRLPTSEVIGYDGKKAVVKAEVFGKGILMWILSQRQFLEVLEPKELREDVKKIIFEMNNIYR